MAKQAISTPGPWIAMHPEDDDYPSYVYGPTMMHRPICEVYGWDDYRKDDGWDHRKNAAMIAAAPQMLAALKLVLQHGRIDDSNSRMQIVAEAITAAEGM